MTALESVDETPMAGSCGAPASSGSTSASGANENGTTGAENDASGTCTTVAKSDEPGSTSRIAGAKNESKEDDDVMCIELKPRSERRHVYKQLTTGSDFLKQHRSLSCSDDGASAYSEGSLETVTKRTKREPTKAITFVCPYKSCRKVSTKRRDHQRHMAAVHNEGVVWFCCRTKGCRFHAKRRDYFQRHIKQTGHDANPLIMEEDRFNRMVQSLFDSVRYKARLRQDEERWRACKMPFMPAMSTFLSREARWRYFQNTNMPGTTSSVSESIHDSEHGGWSRRYGIPGDHLYAGGPCFDMAPRRGAFLCTDTLSSVPSDGVNRSASFPMSNGRRPLRSRAESERTFDLEPYFDIGNRFMSFPMLNGTDL